MQGSRKGSAYISATVRRGSIPKGGVQKVSDEFFLPYMALASILDLHALFFPLQSVCSWSYSTIKLSKGWVILESLVMVVFAHLGDGSVLKKPFPTTAISFALITLITASTDAIHHLRNCCRFIL